MLKNKFGPYMVRQWAASKSINDAWFYIDRRGLSIVAETVPTLESSPRQQHVVGIIPWAQVKRALKTHQRIVEAHREGQ